MTKTANKLLMVSLAAILLTSLVFGCGGGGNAKLDNSSNQSNFQEETVQRFNEKDSNSIKQIYGISPNELMPFPTVDQAIAMQQTVIRKRHALTKTSTRADITYDRAAATEYALAWSVEELNHETPIRNSQAFRTFNNNCTNFASQCLLAGGVPMFWGAGSLRSVPLFWWYKPDQPKNGQSWSWTQAWAFHLFLYFKIGELKPNFHDLEKGDFIFLDYNSNGFVDHTVIVTDRQGYDNLYISANTADHHNLSFVDFWRQVERNPKRHGCLILACSLCYC